MFLENENTEFKSQFTDEIYKEVIAFANTDGGNIFIGVDDKGNEIGLDDPDDIYTRITNGIRDAIQPDVTMFIRYMLQKNKIIKIEVSEGSYKPYYLKSKGIKPNGVYVRQGASSVPASMDMIRQMIKNSDGNTFENMRSLDQELTFEEAEKTFSNYNVEFRKEKFAKLGLINLHDGQYTNLAFLLSDQCQHSIKAAVFADETMTVFKDAKEFKGSIFRQLNDAYSYLLINNRTSAVFNGLERIESKDYPDEAIREALLNAIVHRDYSFSGSIIININDYCMEFISLGGLLSGLSVDDICNGVSQPRNRDLAEIFHRLKLIESYGTGIRRILKLYENYERKPEIIVTPNAFKLIIPNMNVSNKHTVVQGELEEAKSKTIVKPSLKITHQMRLVLDYLSDYGEMGDEDIQDILNVKRTRAYMIARQMIDMGLINCKGRGTGKRYYLQ